MTELALKLIAENKKTRSPFLDLSNCGLIEVPSEISELVWLKELSFSSKIGSILKKKQNTGPQNKISRLGPTTFSGPAIFCSQKSVLGKTVESNPFNGLRNLRKLYLNGGLDEPIALNNLSPLSCLGKLQVLDVSMTKVTNLSPLTNLGSLQQLNISSTPVTDLSPLSGLTNLQELNVHRTSVIDLLPLAGLVNLQVLYLARTLVSKLAPLSGLVNLKRLDVSYTTVADLSPLLELIKNDLPVRLRFDSSLDNGIYVENCPLINPPAEIVRQGNISILNYFHEKVSQGTDHLYEAKMLIIGEPGSGKTSLLRRLYQTGAPLPDEKETTKGIDVYQHRVQIGQRIVTFI